LSLLATLPNRTAEEGNKYYTAFGRLELEAGAGAGGWSGVREK